MTARPITMPAVAPNAWTGARDDQPGDRGGRDERREARHDGEHEPGEHHRAAAEAVGQRPSTSCETAMPSRNSESVSCTVPAPAPSVTIRPGIAGARMLSESGPTAVMRDQQGEQAIGMSAVACCTIMRRTRSAQARSGLVAAVEPRLRVGGDERHQRSRRRARDRRRARRSRRRSSARTRSAARRIGAKVSVSNAFIGFSAPSIVVSVTSTRFSMRMP